MANLLYGKYINEHTLGCGWEVTDFKIRHSYSLINIMLNIIHLGNVRIEAF